MLETRTVMQSDTKILTAYFRTTLLKLECLILVWHVVCTEISYIMYNICTIIHSAICTTLS